MFVAKLVWNAPIQRHRQRCLPIIMMIALVMLPDGLVEMQGPADLGRSFYFNHFPMLASELALFLKLPCRARSLAGCQRTGLDACGRCASERWSSGGPRGPSSGRHACVLPLGFGLASPLRGFSSPNPCRAGRPVTQSQLDGTDVMSNLWIGDGARPGALVRCLALRPDVHRTGRLWRCPLSASPFHGFNLQAATWDRECRWPFQPDRRLVAD